MKFNLSEDYLHILHLLDDTQSRGCLLSSEPPLLSFASILLRPSAAWNIYRNCGDDVVAVVGKDKLSRFSPVHFRPCCCCAVPFRLLCPLHYSNHHPSRWLESQPFFDLIHESSSWTQIVWSNFGSCSKKLVKVTQVTKLTQLARIVESSLSKSETPPFNFFLQWDFPPIESLNFVLALQRSLAAAPRSRGVTRGTTWATGWTWRASAATASRPHSSRGTSTERRQTSRDVAKAAVSNF